MTVFPKVEFWGERLVVKGRNPLDKEMEEDLGYGSIECPCGLKLYIHPGNGAYCPNCGLSADRDPNASKNILARGLAGIGTQSVEAAPL